MKYPKPKGSIDGVMRISIHTEHRFSLEDLAITLGHLIQEDYNIKWDEVPKGRVGEHFDKELKLYSIIHKHEIYVKLRDLTYHHGEDWITQCANWRFADEVMDWCRAKIKAYFPEFLEEEVPA